jgi:serine protease
MRPAVLRTCFPLLMVVLGAAVCVPEKPPIPPQLVGSIAGTIVVGGATGAAADGNTADRMAISRLGKPPGGVPFEVHGRASDADVHWMPGRGGVLFDSGLFDQHSVLPAIEAVAADAQVRDVAFRVEGCAGALFCVFRFTVEGKVPDEDQTAQVLAAMNKYPGPFRLVSRDMIHHGMLAPNDPEYSRQWHYGRIGLEEVWDISTGDPDMVIAVVDSGVVTGHPDLRDRLTRNPADNTLYMADWVNEGISLDGDDIDLIAEDPGDNAAQDGTSTYHGTHTSGTIAAETNNGQGVAGVTWSGQILPVRVLGAGLGGAAFDILQGILWAVGDRDTGRDELVANTLKPAKLVNLSLGGPASEQDAIWQETVSQIINNFQDRYPQRPVLICAAGNSQIRAEQVVPANLDDIITVGAIRVDGVRAVYSNFGPKIDVMAPGGQLDLDQNGDGQPDGVWSTWENTSKFQHGTSMATPHVTGVVALILAAVPNQTHQQIHALLVDTADAAYRCDEGCGAGLIRPLQAILVAGAVPPEPTPVLSVSAREVFFPTGIQSRFFSVDNIGNQTMDYTVVVEGPDAGLFTVTPTTGLVAASSSTNLTVSLARAGATTGTATIRITVASEQPQERLVELRFDDDQYAPRIATQVQVSLYTRQTTGELEVAQQVLATAATGFTYRFDDLLPGQYEVYGVGDDNRDSIFDSLRESFGAYPSEGAPAEEKVITLASDQDVAGIDFTVSVRTLEASFRDGAVGSPCDPTNTPVDCVRLDRPGNEPGCIGSWADGYCTRTCDASDPCPAGSVCQPLICDGGECNVCLQMCVSDFQCREGYVCDFFGNCTPPGFE